VVPEPGLISETQSLLWEGEQVYVIRLPAAQGGAVVQIDKEMVGSVILNPTSDPPVTPDARVEASPIALR
jgi:hypothetical protein